MQKRFSNCLFRYACNVIGDIFDSMTLDRSEQLFTFVENNVTVWKEDLFFSACKNNLLTMCNDLEDCLDHNKLYFLDELYYFWPSIFLSLKGLVLILLVNSIWKIIQNLAVKNQKEMILEQITKDDDKSEAKLPIDYNLYRKFWALQDFFRNFISYTFISYTWKCTGRYFQQ